MKGYYHISSHGLERNDIFKCDADFVQGMNDVAICVLGYEVSILCFCLMSNHFHFLLFGNLEECRRFADEYKRRCGIRMRRSGGEVKGLKALELQIDYVDSKEYLENVVAYILRNPMAAGIRIMPYNYKWSSASLYFNTSNSPVGKRLNDLSERKRFRVLKSWKSVPDNYCIGDEGFVLPACYVDVSRVEQIFGSPSRLMFLLSKKIEHEVELCMGIANQVTMTDQEILTQMKTLMLNEFGTSLIEQLSAEQRISLCLLLKRNYRANVKQIARLTRLAVDVVERVV